MLHQFLLEARQLVSIRNNGCASGHERSPEDGAFFRLSGSSGQFVSIEVAESVLEGADLGFIIAPFQNNDFLASLGQLSRQRGAPCT
jgi:hypothetical protein